MRSVAVDVLIVGGGMVGAVLLHALQGLSFDVMLVDENEPFCGAVNDADGRSITLSRASVAIFKSLGVWDALLPHVTWIQSIHVSERGALGQARLSAEHHQPLGAVIDMHRLRSVFSSVVDASRWLHTSRLIAFDKDNVRATVTTPEGPLAVSARIVIGADGANSCLRRLCDLPVTVKDYKASAVVTNVALKRAHEGMAYERFMPCGPMALLPLSGQRAGVVWVDSSSGAEHLMQMPDRVFLQALQRTFGYRLGRFTQVGPRVSYPLRQVIMPINVWQDRVVFIGNAAHTLHPVAGQGLNLGLRDVAMLVQCLAQHGLTNASLTAYEQSRQDDSRRIIRFSDGLVQLFTNTTPGLSLLRRTGLILLDQSKLVQKIVARHAGGFGGVVSDMICGIELKQLRRQQVSILC